MSLKKLSHSLYSKLPFTDDYGKADTCPNHLPEEFNNGHKFSCVHSQKVNKMVKKVNFKL